jgi:hypothetical protein
MIRAPNLGSMSLPAKLNLFAFLALLGFCLMEAPTALPQGCVTCVYEARRNLRWLPLIACLFMLINWVLAQRIHRGALVAGVACLASLMVWAGTWLVIEHVFPRIPTRLKYLNSARTVMLACQDYAARHNGDYPPSIATLVTDSDLQERAPLWSDLHYVSGLRQTDPPDIPLLFWLPENNRTKFAVVVVQEGSCMIIPRKYVSDLVHDPCQMYADAFPFRGSYTYTGLTAKARDDLSRRIRVLPPVKNRGH